MGRMLVLLLAAVSVAAVAPTGGSKPVPVTADNFNRVESHLYFNNSLKGGGSGKFHHVCGMIPIDNQTVIRANRDTLYSSGVFDLNAGPVTVTLPNSGGRFMSIIASISTRSTRPTRSSPTPRPWTECAN